MVTAKELMKAQLESTVASFNTTDVENYESTDVEMLKHSNVEHKTSTKQHTKNTTIPQPNKTTHKHSKKTSDNDLQTRAVNIMMRDDFYYELGVLALKRRIPKWVVLDEAIGQYLKKSRNRSTALDTDA